MPSATLIVDVVVQFEVRVIVVPDWVALHGPSTAAALAEEAIRAGAERATSARAGSRAARPAFLEDTKDLLPVVGSALMGRGTIRANRGPRRFHELETPVAAEHT